MKRISLLLMAAALLLVPVVAHASTADSLYRYTPSEANLANRQHFSDDRFGIFLHWGIYSLFAQGEWYMNRGIDCHEYAKAADAFYPHRFNAREWVSAIKASGARYICVTTRHHDGFSMWDTEFSPYNIVDATPFGRDVIAELYDECQRQGIELHLYYSHLDWTRPDYYPLGRTGLNTGRTTHGSWSTYYQFMNSQIGELLTRFPNVRALWFDGWWDHDSDSVPFNWQLPEQYQLIHSLAPACLVANNHHQNPFPGEDIQIFERDVPGENHAGLSEQDISALLPLETCQTMNGMWGYKVSDQNYKSTAELLSLLVRTASKGANLLLNVGPQPNGQLPAAALARLDSIGSWLSANGESVYGTRAGLVPEQPWGVTTTSDDGFTLYLHLLSPERFTTINLPDGIRVRSAYMLLQPDRRLRFRQRGSQLSVSLPESEAGTESDDLTGSTGHNSLVLEQNTTPHRVLVLRLSSR